MNLLFCFGLRLVQFCLDGFHVRQHILFFSRVAQKGSGVIDGGDEILSLTEPDAVFFGDLEIRLDDTHGCDSAEADDHLWLNKTELFAQVTDAGILFFRKRITVLGRTALENVGYVDGFPRDIDRKEEFIEIFREKITRPGADALLDYLENKSDFFTAPASARYHGAYAGGLCDHSLNVYHCLVDYLARERVQELYGLEYSEESVAVVALLHDLCKVGCYKKSFRNVKNDATGQWERVTTFTFDDPLPYGHGEKSVYIVNGFIRLTREEAMAIRWHMGFSGPEDARTVGQAFQKYPLAFALATADMEASYFLENEENP